VLEGLLVALFFPLNFNANGIISTVNQLLSWIERMKAGSGGHKFCYRLNNTSWFGVVVVGHNFCCYFCTVLTFVSTYLNLQRT